MSAQNVHDFEQARARLEERESALREREAEDMRVLQAERPYALNPGGVAWLHTRVAEPFEDAPENAVVCVSAVTTGLSLCIERKFIRGSNGGITPIDRDEISALQRSGDLDCCGDVPTSKDAPRTGLRLRVELVESDERSRVVAGQGVRQ